MSGLGAAGGPLRPTFTSPGSESRPLRELGELVRCEAAGTALGLLSVFELSSEASRLILTIVQLSELTITDGKPETLKDLSFNVFRDETLPRLRHTLLEAFTQMVDSSVSYHKGRTPRDSHRLVLLGFCERFLRKLDPMHYAIEEGSLHLLKWLAKQPGANLNAKNQSGETLLHIAVRCGHPEIVKFLAEYEGIHLNARNAEEETPLHIAIRCGNPEIVKFLAAVPDVNLNALDRFRRTPLDYAIRYGDPGTVGCLAKASGTRLLKYNPNGTQGI